jgi:hypothetical protein
MAGDLCERAHAPECSDVLVSLGVWGLIAIWNQIRVYELLLTWQRIAVDLAVVSGLVMLAALVHAAWLRLSR